MLGDVSGVVADVVSFLVMAYSKKESWSVAMADEDTVWIGEDAVVFYEVAAQGVRVPFTAASAYRNAYGYERCLVFKAVTANIRSARVIVETD